MSWSELPERLGWAWKAAFWPASLAYGAVVRARTAAYRTGALETVRLPVPVICIGNLTVGGSGKTPGVIWLVEHLKSLGRRPAVLTRGYGARGRAEPRVVSDGQGTVLPAAEAGDEPFLLARRLPDTAIVAGADRAAAGELALETFRPDALVMDDGYQHLRLYRDLNLLCLDALEALAVFARGPVRPGGGLLLPAGRLREPLSALWRAGVLLLTRAETAEPQALSVVRRRAEECLLDVPVVPVRGVTAYREHVSGAGREGASFRGGKVLAVSGLARPGSFEGALRRLGASVTPMRFPDHHFFSPPEREAVLSRARTLGAEVVVTEKDAVRLPADFPCVVARLDWSPEDVPAREKGDTTPLPRTVPWTERIASALS